MVALKKIVKLIIIWSYPFFLSLLYSHKFDNLYIYIVFIFLYYFIFKLLYKFWYVFFYLYNFNIFIYSYYIHIVFNIIRSFTLTSTKNCTPNLLIIKKKSHVFASLENDWKLETNLNERKKPIPTIFSLYETQTFMVSPANRFYTRRKLPQMVLPT